jgi:hypothetical protein
MTKLAEKARNEVKNWFQAFAFSNATCSATPRAQCGGLDYSGGGCCRDVRDACVKVDDFFWQCTPDPDAPL